MSSNNNIYKKKRVDFEEKIEKYGEKKNIERVFLSSTLLRLLTPCSETLLCPLKT